MKKGISLLLVILCLVSFSACGSPESKARKTAESFMTAVTELDVIEAQKYVNNTAKLPGIFDMLSVERIIGLIPGEFGDYAEDIRKVLVPAIDKAKAVMSYEIKSMEENNGEFIFIVDVVVPDIGADALSSIFDKDAIVKFIKDVFTESGVSITDGKEKIIKAVLPKLLSFAEDTISNVEFQKETKEMKLVVSEKDGSWLVDTDKSKLD